MKLAAAALEVVTEALRLAAQRAWAPAALEECEQAAAAAALRPVTALLESQLQR